MSHAKVIVFDVTLGERPSFQMLFPRGDEESDHRVTEVPLEGPLTNRFDAFAAARGVIDRITFEELADLKARSRPVDRRLLSRA